MWGGSTSARRRVWLAIADRHHTVRCVTFDCAAMAPNSHPCMKSPDDTRAVARSPPAARALRGSGTCGGDTEVGAGGRPCTLDSSEHRVKTRGTKSQGRRRITAACTAGGVSSRALAGRHDYGVSVSAPAHLEQPPPPRRQVPPPRSAPEGPAAAPAASAAPAAAVKCRRVASAQPLSCTAGAAAAPAARHRERSSRGERGAREVCEPAEDASPAARGAALLRVRQGKVRLSTHTTWWGKGRGNPRISTPRHGQELARHTQRARPVHVGERTSADPS